jgi:hypothetical protein
MDHSLTELIQNMIILQIFNLPMNLPAYGLPTYGRQGRFITKYFLCDNNLVELEIENKFHLLTIVNVRMLSLLVFL